MESNGKRRFSGRLKEVPVEFEEFLPRQFVVRQANAEIARRYRNANAKGYKLIGEGADAKAIPQDGFADADLILLAGCLCEVKDNNSKVPVGEDFVKALPYPEQAELSDLAFEISDIYAKEDPEAIKRRIERDQEKLAKLEAGLTPEQEAKN